MGVQTISYLPGIELPSKNVFPQDNGQFTLHVKYNDFSEKVIVSPDTTSEELSRTLLSICGVAFDEDLNGFCLSLSKPNGLQIVGVLEPNQKDCPYEIRIVQGNFV
jgi:hypothetical protein